VTPAVGVVGLGYWGPNLARNLQELPEADLVAVCDRDENSLAKLSRRYPALRRESDFQVVLDDPSIEAVALATPVGTHYPLALRALEAGKHVFVEKPLAGSSTEALHLVETARERDLTIVPGHTFLYSPSVNLIREQIQLGTIGTPHFVSMSRVNLGLHQNDVSVVWDLGSHDFSILRYWLGENPVNVSAIGRSCVIPGRDDVAFINLEYASGTIAHVELSWLAPSKLRRTTIVGSEKMIVYDDTSQEPVRIFDSGVSFRDPQSFGEFQLSYRMGDIVSPRLENVEPLLLEMFDFCRPRTGRSVSRSFR
jgi:predicted dehydrogenase